VLLFLLLFGAGFFLLRVGQAHAIPFGFHNITANNVNDALIGERQLYVDVTDPGLGSVLFTFFNTGPDASAITDVYFDDGTLLALAGLIDADEGSGGDPGVDFSIGASPSNLPGGSEIDPPFSATAGFSSDADPPVQPDGVNPGESLGILFDLQAGSDFSEVIAQLSSGALRIGIHVQGFESEGSESFVNDPEPIPEPATMLLFGTGLIGLAGVGRTLRKRGM
jgi:hypothetical protein